MDIIISFYSSQKGITPIQKSLITLKLENYSKESTIKEFRHCDTLFDVDIHEYVLTHNLAETIHLYPPINTEIRGFSAATNKVIINEEMTLSQGLKNICKDTDVMIIAPHEGDEKHNGSYIAKEQAKKMNVKKIITIDYDGTVSEWPTLNMNNIKKRMLTKKQNI